MYLSMVNTSTSTCMCTGKAPLQNKAVKKVRKYTHV